MMKFDNEKFQLQQRLIEFLGTLLSSFTGGWWMRSEESKVSFESNFNKGSWEIDG